MKILLTKLRKEVNDTIEISIIKISYIQSIILFVTVILISLQQFRPRSAIVKNSFYEINLQKKKRKMACAQGKIMRASRRSCESLR